MVIMNLDNKDEIDRHSSPSRLPTSERRVVGRPKQSASPVGKAGLLEKMRQFMKEKTYYDFQRKDIAEFSNVTPATISYYFPEKQDFVIEAASPIILAYSDDVSRILHSEDPLLAKTERLVSKFIELGLRSGYTIDYFLVAIQARKRGGDIRLVAEHYAGIHKFMEELVSVGSRSSLNPSFLQSSIWAQCMYLSRQPHLQNAQRAESQEEIIQSLTADVINLLTNGISILG